MRPIRLLASALAVMLASSALAQGLVMTEYNAVGSTKFLAGGTATVDLKGGTASDSWFGRVQGNGGNWIELVVTQDHLDLRGWKLRWAETGNSATNGINLWYGSTTVEQGIITFASSTVWSDMRAGTVITICEYGSTGPTGYAGKDVDLTFDPCRGDWWINVVSVGRTDLVTTTTNVTGNSPGNFSVGNNNWLMEIRDAANNLRMASCGEGAPGWLSSGVSSTEVCKLKAQVSGSLNNGLYGGGDTSTFGTPNNWTDPVFTTCRSVQNLASLRAPVVAECGSCTPIFLNEYNAVAADQYLNGGNAAVDANGGAAADSFFGRVLGNGGNWFEMVVNTDKLDLRGWTFAWSERKTGGLSGNITLAQNPGLASVPAGTIITFIERNTANGGKDTDLTVNAAAGDRWMNIYTRDAAVVSAWTSTKPGTTFGSITSSNDNWRVEVRDASGSTVAGPFGEGADQYWRGGVANTDVCHLRETPGRLVTMASNYDDTARFSNFGAPNNWAECPDDGTVFTQSLAGLGACSASTPCPGDIDASGTVDAGDIGSLLILFGSSDPAGDLDQSGMVDAGDIGSLLILFGNCP